MTNPNFPELKIDCAHCLFGCSAVRAKNVQDERKRWTKVQMSIFECRIHKPVPSTTFPEINLNDWCGYFCDAETMARPFYVRQKREDELDPAQLRHTPAQPRKIHADEQPREEVAE